MEHKGQEITRQSQSLAIHDTSYMKLRLDTQALHKKILNFLEGKRSIVSYNNNTGEWVEGEEKNGEPLANERGVQSILSLVIMLVNEHTIQGNTKDKQDLNTHLYYIEDTLNDSIARNWKYWGIDKRMRDYLIDCIMHFVSLVLSRTIGNKERESYSGSIEKTTNYYAPKGKDKVL